MASQNRRNTAYSYDYMICSCSKFVLSIDIGPTLCQRQLQMYMRADDHRQLEPSCNQDGSFRDIQCYGAECYCVDSRGVEIQRTRKNFIDGKPICEKKCKS